MHISNNFLISLHILYICIHFLSLQLELDTLVPSNAGTKKDSSKHKSIFQKWKDKAKR